MLPCVCVLLRLSVCLCTKLTNRGKRFFTKADIICISNVLVAISKVFFTNGFQANGFHFTWNGTDESGSPNVVVFCTHIFISQNSYTSVRRIINLSIDFYFAILVSSRVKGNEIVASLEISRYTEKIIL